MSVRRFHKEDLTSILNIQEENLAAAQWSRADYDRLAEDPEALILVAEHEMITPQKVIGFAVFHCLLEEAELRNLAVLRAHQRQGIGKTLLREAKERLARMGTRRVYLEVRPSNQAALNLYQATGFAPHSIRKGYYKNPDEDALVLLLEIQPPAG